MLGATDICDSIVLCCCVVLTDHTGASKVMQLPSTSVCTSLHFQSSLGTKSPLTWNFCVWLGHELSLQGFEGHRSNSTSRFMVMQSVRPRWRPGQFSVAVCCSRPVSRSKFLHVFIRGRGTIWSTELFHSTIYTAQYFECFACTRCVVLLRQSPVRVCFYCSC